MKEMEENVDSSNSGRILCPEIYSLIFGWSSSMLYDKQ